MLVLGPFLILLAFGLGYRQSPDPYRTLFVTPPGSPFADEVEGYAGDLGRFVHYDGTTSDDAAARARLDRGDVDVVVEFPADPLGTVLSGQAGADHRAAHPPRPDRADGHRLRLPPGRRRDQQPDPRLDRDRGAAGRPPAGRRVRRRQHGRGRRRPGHRPGRSRWRPAGRRRPRRPARSAAHDPAAHRRDRRPAGRAGAHHARRSGDHGQRLADPARGQGGRRCSRRWPAATSPPPRSSSPTSTRR